MQKSNKIHEVELQIMDSKKTAERVIVNLLDREEKLADLENKSNDLRNESKMFYKKSKKVKRKMWKGKCIAKMLILFMVLLFIYFILAMSCGFDLSECKITK